jgi:hypothetical protein
VADHFARKQDLVTKEEMSGIVGLLQRSLSDAAATPALGGLFALVSVALCLSVGLNIRQWRSAREKEAAAAEASRGLPFGGRGDRSGLSATWSRSLQLLPTPGGRVATLRNRGRSVSPCPSREAATLRREEQLVRDGERENPSQINITVET